MYIKIIQADAPADMAKMEAFVTADKNSHFLQSPQWRTVKTLWQWRGILAFRTDGQLLGALSVLIRPLPLGMSILYAPRGPICDRMDSAVMAGLMQGVEQIAKQRRALLFYMDPDEPDTNEDFRHLMKSFGFQEQTATDFGNIQPQYVFRLKLQNRTEADIFAGFSAKTRYNIRLAARRGVSVRQYSGKDAIPESAINAFDQLMKTTGQRDHFLVRDGAYFRRLLAAYQDKAVLFLASLDGEPIAGTIGIFYGNKAWYLYGASANCHRNAMPNYLLQWEMLRHAAALGCDLYDFRGVPGDLSETNPLYGLYRFKKGFGGDYTKFTGLFIRRFRPVLSRLFLMLLARRGHGSKH